MKSVLALLFCDCIWFCFFSLRRVGNTIMTLLVALLFWGLVFCWNEMREWRGGESVQFVSVLRVQ